jgi:hypothetical protein
MAARIPQRALPGKNWYRSALGDRLGDQTVSSGFFANIGRGAPAGIADD